MKKFFLILLSILLVSCSAVTPSMPQIVNVYASAAAQPWLETLYSCAQEESVILNISAESPQIQLRLGQLDGWTGSVFQVGTEEIVLAASLQSPLGNLTLVQAEEIFSGRGNLSTQVWAYASGEDIQKVFEQAVMNGRNVNSFARLAVNPAHMSEALSADVNAVGFLPRRYVTSGLRELLTVASVPVLVLTPSEPEGILRNLIACMQK
jgi:hypothetical protein